MMEVIEERLGIRFGAKIWVEFVSVAVLVTATTGRFVRFKSVAIGLI